MGRVEIIQTEGDTYEGAQNANADTFIAIVLFTYQTHQEKNGNDSDEQCTNVMNHIMVSVVKFGKRDQGE